MGLHSPGQLPALKQEQGPPQLPWPQVQGCDKLLQVLRAYAVKMGQVLDAVLLQKPDVVAVAAAASDHWPVTHVAAAVPCIVHHAVVSIRHAIGKS